MKRLRAVLLGLVALVALTASSCPEVKVTCDKDGCRIEGHIHR